MANMMEYKGYHAKIEYDPDDNILVGKVIGIADSLNFHAQSTDELVSMFHQSIENYLELCERIGKSPEKEYSGTFNIRITPELHKKAYLKAQQDNISINKVVENALYTYLFPEKAFVNKFAEEVLAFANSMKNLSSSISLTTESEANGNTPNFVKKPLPHENYVYLPTASVYNISKVQSALS